MSIHQLRRNRVFALLATLISFGCASTPPHQQKREVYVLTSDVFLVQTSAGLFGKRLALVPESNETRGSGFYASPKSISEYLAEPKHELWDGGVGVVPFDTSIEMLGTKRKRAFSFFYGFVTDEVHFGRIMDGRYKGTTVDLEDVSIGRLKG